MATNIENDFPPSQSNDESDPEYGEELQELKNEPTDSVARILQQLQSSGALIKKPKQEYICKTCDQDFSDWEDLEEHLKLEHVTQPSIVLEKVPSDDELDHSGEDEWSDEEDAPPQKEVPKTPKKIDVSQLLKKTGLQIKKPGENKNTNSSAALDKLSGLGFTIKKNHTPIKEEKTDTDKPNNDLMQKLGKLGGIKLKLKSDGGNTNSFKVVNGLKDFKTSDNEDEGSGNEDNDDEEDENDKSGDQDASAGERESGDEQPESNSRKNSESDDSSKGPTKKALRRTKTKLITPKVEPVSDPQPSASPPARRQAVKQTPMRNSNLVGAQIKSAQQNTQPEKPTESPKAKPVSKSPRTSATQETKNVVVKKEVDNDEATPQSVPLFSGPIKTERSSPPREIVPPTPLIAQVKTETETTPQINSAPPVLNDRPLEPLMPVTKTESSSVTIIEINGDSNDEDDDCCVVSATPAPDVKPIIPKTENVSYSTPSFSSTQSNFSPSLNNTSRMPTPSTEKQHSFNWNAPDSKPPLDMLEKSADDIFESLLSSTKKEGGSLSEVSEYISLDRLGSQHTCDVCSTRFTDISLLQDHIRQTGHSKSIVTPSSSLMPYGSSSNSSLLSSLLPVKQLAEQVGKLSTINSAGSGFTHQQNVMINIQAYPGASGMMAPPQTYNQYPGQSQPSYNQSQSGMYGQSMSGQYPNQYQNQQGFSQPYGQTPMSSYSNAMPQNPYSSVPPAYSTSSPLQGMQQAVYSQTPGMMSQSPTQQMGQMGPPGMIPYVPTSSPSGLMKPPMSTTSNSGIRIQNVQTFQPGQLGDKLGQPLAPGQPSTIHSPGQLKVAGNLTGARPRAPSTVRGARPTIRPGIQVQGQIRGARAPGPRMMKRPGVTNMGPPQKRRPDMLLPGKHDNEDCQVMSLQKQRDGLPMISNVQGAKDKLNLGSQISITKKTVNKEANAMANVLASRGISIKQKQKSRSPTPERPVPHIPNLGAGVSIKHTSKSSNFSIPEAKVGSGMYSCKICKKMFMNSSSLAVHMSNAHPQSKIPVFKCDECPASYPKSLQLQHHKRTFHNVTGANRELGLPVVDLSQTDNLKRLNSLGIYSFIPLANREQANGTFGIPIISVHNMQNGLTSNLQALGADGLLSLGPLKPLPNS